MSFDFSLQNPVIRAFFDEEDNSVPPVSEFLYLHSHPLVTKNFINEIDRMVDRCTTKYTGGLPGPLTDKLMKYGIVIGTRVMDVEKSETARTAATDVLLALRELYKTVKEV